MTKKLCKDQKKNLVAKLKPLFHGLASDDITEAVSEAKKGNDLETIEEHKNILAKLFDDWMETFRVVNCSKVIIEMFLEQKEEAVKKMSEIWTEMYAGETLKSLADRGIYLGIPVVPRPYMTIYGLMLMVRNGENVGYTYLDPNKLSDVVETPDKPYFMFNVEDGRDMLGKSPKKSEELIKKKERSCLVDNEGIALCIHADVLSHHNVDCTGSRCKQGDEVPHVCLNDDRPKLSSDGIGYSHDEWGSASCRSRG